MIRIRGQLIGNVRLNCTSYTRIQRVLVVERLVVPMILGIDFLICLGKITFDFHRSKLQLHEIKNEINLVHNYGMFGRKVVNMQGFKK